MMKLQKFTVLLLALVLVLTGVRVPVSAQSDTTDVITEDSSVFLYEELQDGSVCLTGYTGTEADLYIPESIDGMAVTEIGESCFAGDIHLVKVHIPEGVTIIHDFAFECCGLLKKAYLPDSLIEIGDGAFSGCASLILMDTQDSVERIGKGAFMRCESLISWVAPTALTEIGEFAFAGCIALKQVDMVNTNVTKIPDRLFANCTELRFANIPYEVTEIGKRAFSKCENITYVTMTDSMERVQPYAFESCSSLIGADLYTEVVEPYTFMECPSLQNLYISDKVKKIENLAFENCYMDTEFLYIPEGVEIEEFAFGSPINDDGMYDDFDNEEEEVIDPSVVSEAIEQEELQAIVEDLGKLVVSNDEFDSWAESYVAFNEDNALCYSELNPYITLYKGQLGRFYEAMTAAASMDPTDLEAAENRFGDDFLEMYQMVNHGLTTEINRFKMEEDMILFTGVYDCQLRAAAGTDHVPSLDELKACIGTTFKDPCLTSTTTDLEVAKHFSNTLFVIIADAANVDAVGAVGIDAYQHTMENEILINSGAEYEVLDVGVFHFIDVDYEGNESDQYDQYLLLKLINE